MNFLSQCILNLILEVFFYPYANSCYWSISCRDELCVVYSYDSGHLPNYLLTLAYSSGLTNLENLNLSFTLVTDSSLRKLSGLTSLKSLNLDARQITDAGLAVLTSKFFDTSCNLN